MKFYPITQNTKKNKFAGKNGNSKYKSRMGNRRGTSNHETNTTWKRKLQKQITKLDQKQLINQKEHQTNAILQCAETIHAEK